MLQLAGPLNQYSLKEERFAQALGRNWSKRWLPRTRNKARRNDVRNEPS